MFEVESVWSSARERSLALTLFHWNMLYAESVLIRRSLVSALFLCPGVPPNMDTFSTSGLMHNMHEN